VKALRRGLLTAGLALLALGRFSAQSPKDPIAQANTALQAGEADRALTLLSSPTAGSAEAHNLKCRVLYTLEQWDHAASECEMAVRMEGNNSNFHLWLGRTLGEKADRASFLNAYSLSKRVRAEFEEAVRLDPRNAEALADLGEFYYSAPSVVGGGSNKAEGVALQLDKVDPARAHELRANIAEEHKDLGTAEREFRLAISAGAHPAFQWMSLASFFRRHERWTEMDTAINSGLHATERDRRASVALYNGASTLQRAHRNSALAAKMIENYLASPAKTEEAPAFVAYTRLADLKDELGDRTAAQQERAAALSLAHEYRPAQEIKH